MEKQSNDARKPKMQHSAPARNWVGDNGKIIEPLFSDYFLSLHPMRCFQGRLFTVDGMIEEMPQTGEDELQAQNEHAACAQLARVVNAFGVIDLFTHEVFLPPTELAAQKKRHRRQQNGNAPEIWEQ